MLNERAFFLLQDGAEAGVLGGRRGAGGTGKRLAARQAGLSCVRESGDPEGRSPLLREGRRHVVAGRHPVHDAGRKVSNSSASSTSLLIPLTATAYPGQVHAGQS